MQAAIDDAVAVYERRMGEQGVTHGPAVQHENASTLNTPRRNFGAQNTATYRSNKALFESGKHHGFDPYRWKGQSWT